jgi:putative ABC transport system permease protein
MFTPVAGAAMSARLRLIASLSIRDLLHEHRLTICSCIALAAVLTPLIVLFGLKNGVIEGLRTDLIDNPRTRMITNASNRNFTVAFLNRLASRPDIVFVAPRLRTLNSEGRFERPDQPGQVRRAELLATGANDPLLSGLPVPTGLQGVASVSLASRLGLKSGMTLTMRVPRANDKEILSVKLALLGIAPPSSFARDAMFVDPKLLLLVDGFVEGTLPPTATLADVANDNDRLYAGFRAHARRLEDVLTIDRDLRAEDIDVETQAAEISGLLGLDRSLTVLFAVLAGLGAVGYYVSLGVGLYANVERKQAELSLLRLIGLLRRNLVLMPVLQGAIIAAVGGVVAAAVSLAGAALLNDLSFLGPRAAAHPLCVVEPWHLALAIATSIVGAAIAAGFAANRAARVTPAEGLKDV